MKRFTLLLALGFAALTGQAAIEEQVNALIPKIASDNVPERYPAKMELLDLASHASRPGAENERAALAKLLAEKATDTSVPQPARVWIVRQLENIGAGESIDALEALLNGPDAELRETARRALEKNPDPGASEPLRIALRNSRQKKDELAWRAGLIHSLGERRDPNSVVTISMYLHEQETAEAAALALSKIPALESIASLMSFYEKGLPAAGVGLLEAANRLLAAKGEEALLYAGGLKRSFEGNPITANRYQARVIYEKLYAPKNPIHFRAAALPGLIRLNFNRGSIILSEALLSPEPELQQAAIAASASDPAHAQKVVELFPQLPSSAKVQVLGILDSSAEKQIIQAASDSEEAVRVAAIQALGRAGGKSSVPVLVQLSSGDSRAEKSAAESALARISGEGAIEALRATAASGNPAQRAAAINTLAARRDHSSLPALLAYADEPNENVSRAALRALGQMATENELEPVGKLAVASKNPEAAAALKTIAARAPDKPSATKRLLDLRHGADAQAQITIVDALSVTGGPEGLNAAKQLAASEDENVKTAAIRALSNWPDGSAIEPLLEMASDPNAPLNHNVLAIRGIARLIEADEKQPAPARVEAAVAALKAARRPDERKLALSALAAVQDRRAAEALRGFLKDSDLQEEAGTAGLTLAERMRRSNAAAARELAQAVRDANISDELNKKADSLLKK
jgi:HEAT repeat protein